MKKYFNLKLKSKKVYGGVIEVDMDADLEHRLSDFINDSFHFKLVKQRKEENDYEITIDREEFRAGACVPALCVNSGPEYVKIGEDKATIFLTNEGVLGLRAIRTKAGERIYLEEITEKKAKELEDASAKWALYQAYIAGY